MNCNDWKARKKYFKRILLFLWLRCMSKFCVNNIFLININIYIHIQRHFTSVLCSTFYHEWIWHIPRKGFDLLQSVLSSLVKLGFSRKGITYILRNRETIMIDYIYLCITCRTARVSCPEWGSLEARMKFTTWSCVWVETSLPFISTTWSPSLSFG